MAETKPLVATIHFGAHEPLPRAGLAGAFSSSSQFIVPRFGKRCICCSADAMGRIQRYDPSTDRVSADPVEMPVCFDCRSHALQSQTTPILMASGICVGASFTALGLYYLSQQPKNAFAFGLLAAGVAIGMASTAWLVATIGKQRRERVEGHHPRLVLSVDMGRTLLHTSNQSLADELVELNPGARRIESKLPAARLIKG